ncbi:Eco57I restriction-modification methylase domain-containing protein [Thiolapillus sp.]|uniref:Eco57I restriction-modification methylase domain-containing protein n=3 Tax=Thiolapillus sp. TaxID=2017437 RepID=UPI0025DD56D0|nr:DNA methyltransferase [Thiolapillus sp.]
MKTLSTEYRRQLERTVVEARDIAEAGSKVALEALAVQHHEPYGHMDGAQRTLRRRLRAHARQLGDRPDARSGGHGIDNLVHECAYEHWHSMLFARFLAENDLLIESEMGVAITLDECEELAKEEGIDKWALAARFAHGMLPQVFRPDHPVFEVQFAREHRLTLEGLIEGLPLDVFTATDSLGWVYQFWQTKKKDVVNRSEVKIGADELPAVTQLFTEPYMVQFLLHNSLGAWWVSRHPDKTCPVDLAYLRWAEDGASAAGEFEGWPDKLSEFRLLDPCCGSGHFLVAAFLILVPMRMALERQNAAEAVDAVLRENLHGLELDQRCVAIAAFALALEAWRFPDAGGFRALPKLNLAWCGQPVAGKKEQWLALAEGDARLSAGMAALFETFRDAPILGSLIDPARSVSEDMLTAGFEELQPLLEKALREHGGEEEWKETAIAALGLAEATRLLSGHYHLVITNVPYLARGKQSDRLRKFAETHYPKAKNDLANVFLERCLEFSKDEGAGVTQIVMPQNWLFLASYKAQREHLLKSARWELLARLGEGGFDSAQAAGAFVILLTMSRSRPHIEHEMHGIDASTPRTAVGKSELLHNGALLTVIQRDQFDNPDARISLTKLEALERLDEYADSFLGLGTGDFDRFGRRIWEFDKKGENWSYLQSAPQRDNVFDGLSLLVAWDHSKNRVYGMDQAQRDRIHNQDQSGQQAWGRIGIALMLMRGLRSSVFCGSQYDKSMAAIIPRNEDHAAPIFAFCNSPEFHERVREIDQNIIVANGTLVKVPFDLAYWTKVASEKYPNGLPKPRSNDPTQWVFHGNPCSSESPLQVVLARLLGYRWPAEKDPSMGLADEQSAWLKKSRTLFPFEDEDGIVCIPSVRSERSAQERMLQLLHTAHGDDWNDGILTKLLAESGCISLDDWLRNKFFDEHCKLFQHRPFIWHIWDGRKRDGFHALVNYHKLAEGDGKGRRLLESLTYSYLGDWIARQQDGVKRGEGGAEDRLAAALELQKRLVAILEGEPPFDLFVRWKPIEEQPIGWEPDINDGVRLNIRPFMAQDLPGGKKGAGILRAKPNIKWGKDRGKEPERDQDQFPWFWRDGKFTGERVNDVHLTNAEKKTARERAEGKSS